MLRSVKAVALLSLIACDKGPSEPNDVTGDYGLTHVNGAALPAPLRDGGGVVTGGLLKLEPGGSASGIVCGGAIICSVVHFQIGGTWSITRTGEVRISSGSMVALASRTADGWTLHWGLDDLSFRRP
jgi:hypothetical protein